jgi:predicted esterase
LGAGTGSSVLSTGPHNTGSCITPDKDASGAVKGSLSFQPCTAANAVWQQFAAFPNIQKQALLHIATGRCVELMSDNTARLATCNHAAKGQGWVLGFAGVLFVEHACLTAAPSPHTDIASSSALETMHQELRLEGWTPPSPADTSTGWKPNWQSGYPAVRDLKAAIRYVRATAAAHNVDPTKVAVTGGSAGATNSLAAGVVFEDDYKSELTVEQDPTLATTHLAMNSSVQAVYTHWSSHGEVDLVTAYDHANRTRWSTTNAPIIEFHGDKDTTIPIQQAYDVQAIYNKTGTVLVFRQDFALEDAIESHACSLEANMRVTNDIHFGSPLLLPLPS